MYNKFVQLLWKAVLRFLKKLTTELPYDPAMSLLSMYLEMMKTLIQKDMCTSMFIASLYAIARTYNQSVSIDRSMDKEYVTYIYIYTYIHTHTHTHIDTCNRGFLVALLVKNPPALWETWI